MRQDIYPKELRERLDSGAPVRIVDVRSALEYGTGHIPGAVNLPLETIDDAIPGVGPGETVVVVCQSGRRSSTACEKIARSHENVFNLVGGTSAWRSAGMEVETDPKAARSIDRQAHFVAAALLFAAFFLSRTVDPGWIYLGLLPAFGLMLDALTGICPMTLILRKVALFR